MITQKRLRELFLYDAETGIFTRRVSVGRHGRHKAHVVAGTRQNHGYVVMCVDGRRYMAHRLAWLYMYGEWPSCDIDHLNGVRNDNRLANLRLATRAQNMQNVRHHKHNTSGYKGVSWMPSRRKWRAYIFVDYKQRHIGLYDTPQEAHVARKKEEQKLHSHCCKTT